jgi:PAS domain S-box-containing protein
MGMIKSLINITVDITDRKQIESKLEKHAEEPSMLEAIVESSDDAIISKTLDGVIRSWNFGAQKLFGYTAQEAVGQHITFIIPDDRRLEEEQIISRLKQGDRIEHFETQRVTKSGSLIDISITVSPIKNAKGQIIGASKIARDISEQKRHAASLIEEEKRKDEFLAILAHELRNPLAPIGSAAEILKLTDSSSKEGQWAVSTIDRQLHHMTRLIDDLLDISRISSDKLQLTEERVPAEMFMRSAIETSEPSIREAQHTLITEFPSEPCFVFGDAVRLSQIVSNLLTNAAKYTPKGGTIWLSARVHEQKLIITVKDTGIGISPVMLPRIFDMFVQGDHGPTMSRGLGIGLTLVKRLLELHKGTIDVESDGTGKGSLFTVTLPTISENATGTTEAPHAVVAKPLRILIVDDNKDAQTALEMTLRLQGNVTAVADDGLRAVEITKTFSPDVILLDIGMPTMNGYEAARIIRGLPEGQKIKIIAVTGWAQKSDKQRAYEAGFDHHLTKPINNAELSALLSAVS